MAKINPQDTAKYVGKSFITRNSRYEISLPSEVREYHQSRCYGESEIGVEKLTLIGSIPSEDNLLRKIWRSILKIDGNPAEKLWQKISIPGDVVYDEEEYQKATKKSEEILKDYLKRYGEEPKEGNRLVLGIKREKEYYHCEPDEDGFQGYPWIIPAIITSTIMEIK